MASRATWSAEIVEGGRHGFSVVDDDRLDEAARALAVELAPGLGRSVLVLGTEELMYAPLRIARALEDRLEGTVRFCSTTRSPVNVVDAPGYPIRNALVFPAFDGPDDGSGARFAYNVASPGTYTDVLVAVDAESDDLYAAGGLVSQLLATGARVQVLRIPTAGLAEPLVGLRVLARTLPGGPMAAQGSVRHRAGGADRGTGGSHPGRIGALRRVSARRVPAQRVVPAALRRGAGQLSGSGRDGGRGRVRSSSSRSATSPPLHRSPGLVLRWVR